MKIENYLSALTKLENVLHNANNALNQIIGALTAERDLRSEDTFEGGDEITENSALVPANKKIPDVRKKEQTMPKLKNIYIYKREKYYYVSVVYNGMRKSFSGKNKSLVISKAKETLTDFKNKDTNIDSNKTLNNLATFYLEKLKKPFISDAYFKTLINRYNLHVKPKIGNYKLNTFTPISLQNYFEELSSYSTRIAEDVKVMLKQIFDYAVANLLIKVNPMKAVLIKKHERINGQALTNEQINLLKTNLNNFTKIKIPILIMLYTGIRGSELLSAQFNFSENTVTVQNSKLKTYQKNKTRVIPILKPLLEFKNEIDSNEWRNVRINYLEKEFPKIIGTGRLNWLRHTFQTFCSLTASNELVNYWAGHTLGKDMTAKVYTHFPMEYQQIIASNILY